MIQGAQLVQRAFAGIAQRLTNPPSAPDRDLESGAAESARIAETVDRLSRPEVSATDDVVTAPARTARSEAITQNQGLAAELVHAETILQIAQDAFAAIETIYADIQDLAESALNGDLTTDQRTGLDAALQALIQEINDIVDTAVFDGYPILQGGDGPDGAFLISLPATGQSDTPLDILVPASSAIKNPTGFGEANLLSVEAAHIAVEVSGKAVETFRLQGGSIRSQRSDLQRIFSTEVDSSRSLSDYVDTSEAPASPEQLSKLVADIVLAGGEVPFADAADRMRNILGRAGDNNQAPTTVTRTAARQTEPPGTGQTGVTDDVVLDDVILDEIVPPRAVPALEAMGRELAHMRGLAEEASTASKGSSAALDDQFQSAKLNFFDTVEQSAEPQGENTLAGGGDAEGDGVMPPSNGAATGERPDIVIPPGAVRDLLPALVGANISSPEAALAIMEKLDEGIGEIARQLDRVVAPQPGGGQPLPQGIPGIPSATQTASSRPDAEATRLPEDVPAGQIGAIAEELTQARNQMTADVRQTELARIGELDAARRAPGPIGQNRDSDIRIETAFGISKPVDEASSDQVEAFGASAFVQIGDFMAELIRADSMLHVADQSIEQIDLHLDYMRGLAEEAATDSSRYRGALDEIFQAVKSNIIDTLAQTTEAQGEKILSGGGGPDGEFVIHLSEGGRAGEGHDIAIPSMRVKDLSPDLSAADIRTRDAATAAVDHIEFASEDTAQAHDMISEQRTLIRQLISLEIARSGSRAMTG